MLDALRFVATAVAKKDFVPALTYFKIEGGRVTGFNGTLALSSPIDCDLDVQPQAAAFMAAIRACPDTIALSVTPAGKLAVKSKNFKSFVGCLDKQDQFSIEPEGKFIDLGPSFLEGVKACAPVMGIDASRPWAMGIKLQRGSMFATNNVMLVEYWHGTEIPIDVVIPSMAVEELLRIDESPSKVQVTRNSISFWFGEGRWLRSALVENSIWPTDKIEQIFAKSLGKQTSFSDDFFKAVDTLGPFLGEHGTCYLTAENISTHVTENEGTSIEVASPAVGEMQAYHQRQLKILGAVAETIDWSAYPAPCKFMGYNGKLRGAIIGQRI